MRCFYKGAYTCVEFVTISHPIQTGVGKQIQGRKIEITLSYWSLAGWSGGEGMEEDLPGLREHRVLQVREDAWKGTQQWEYSLEEPWWS